MSRLIGFGLLLFVACAVGHGGGLSLNPDEWSYTARPDNWVPAGAHEVAPDTMWIAEYHNAEKCSGLKGDVSRVHWFSVPGNFFTDSTGIEYAGFWWDSNIYISYGHRNFEWVVRHESLHDILLGGGHNTQIFGIECKAMPGYLE